MLARKAKRLGTKVTSADALRARSPTLRPHPTTNIAIANHQIATAKTLVAKCKNLLHRALIRFERVAIARHRVRHVRQKT
jgi:hypothetical protein